MLFYLLSYGTAKHKNTFHSQSQFMVKIQPTHATSSAICYSTRMVSCEQPYSGTEFLARRGVGCQFRTPGCCIPAGKFVCGSILLTNGTARKRGTHCGPRLWVFWVYVGLSGISPVLHSADPSAAPVSEPTENYLVTWFTTRGAECHVWLTCSSY